MDQTQYEAAYAHFQPWIRHWFNRQLGDLDLAEDLTGDVFEKAWRNWERWDDRNVQGVLFRTAMNVLVDNRRHARVVHFQALEAPLVYGGNGPNASGAMVATVVLYTARDNVERDALTLEALTVWQNALGALMDREREAITLRIDGWSCSAIGIVLGCTRGAVKSLLFRARAHLRLALPPDWEQAV